MYSEQEMKEFFQNVVDQIATLSTQAEKVQGLEQRILNMSDRIREMEQSQRQTVEELHATQSALSDVQRRLDVTSQDLSNERAVTQNLRDVLVSRDTKVQELEQNNQVERDAHKVTLSERDDARRRGEELDREVQSFREQVNTLEIENGQWRARAYKAEAQSADYKQQLDKINSLLNPSAVSRDFQVVG